MIVDCCPSECQAACGITDKPREVIEDIDKLDVNNQLAVVEYVEDIYTFYKTAEVTAEISAMSITWSASSSL